MGGFFFAYCFDDIKEREKTKVLASDGFIYTLRLFFVFTFPLFFPLGALFKPVPVYILLHLSNSNYLNVTLGVSASV